VGQDIGLESLGKLIEQLDDAGQTAQRLSRQKTAKDEFLFVLAAQAKRFDEQIVGGLIFGLDQRVDQAIEHSLDLSDPAPRGLESYHGRFPRITHRNGQAKISSAKVLICHSPDGFPSLRCQRCMAYVLIVDDEPDSSEFVSRF